MAQAATPFEEDGDLSTGWLLLLPAVLCPWQILLPNQLGPLSLLQLSLVPLTAALFTEIVLSPRKPLVPVHVPFVMVVLLALGCVASAAWSPDPNLALRSSVKIGGIALVAVVAASASVRVHTAVATVLLSAAVVLAVAIIVFRAVPILEQGFLFSSWATFTMDIDVLSGIREGSTRVNILAPERAGAIFTNANVASLFLGLVLCLGYAVRAWTPLWVASVPLVLAAVVATGSKGGLVAMMAVGVLGVLVMFRRGFTLGRVGLTIIAGVALIVFGARALLSSGLIEVGVSAGSTRFEIWGAALPLLFQYPLTGLGFGGWELWAAENFRYLGISEHYPPENMILIVWAWMGLGGAVLAVWFLASTIIVPGRSLVRHLRVDSRMELGLTLFFVWFFIQSMLTNAAFTDFRIGLPLGVALGLLSRTEEREA